MARLIQADRIISAFLDERHERAEYVSPNDNNIYTLGRVGKHNVVKAALPDGKYGIASAAITARDMLHSFPNVRIGLMVGIGGGAPSRKHDIRLGDIVVSAPRDGNGGVFQYDFGKTIQGQTFQTTGYLDQPPILLRAAASDIRAEYESEGHQLEEAVQSVLEKKSRLQKKYKRPDPNSDRLYQSRVVHPIGDEVSCEASCGNDTLNIVSRPERTEEEDNPAIHYGLIASANQLMKDAIIRDELSKERDVLCFEMEAAGLMNHFPCIVIRGICDYSDSHKRVARLRSDGAAAYAKDLLSRIAPSKVEAEKRISDILSVIADVQEGIGKVRFQHSQEHIKILDLLTPINYDAQQSDNFNQRYVGTGQWLLDSPKFHAWLQTNGQVLFCPGIPGTGKTVPTSIVIDNLTTRFVDDKSIGIAYLYCNYKRKDEQKASHLIANLLKQLAGSRASFPEVVKFLYESHVQKRTRPSFDEVSKTLQSLVALYSKVIVIIDALDECQLSDGSRTKLLAEIFDLQSKHEASIFATSRFIPEITAEFSQSISVEIRASREDVQRYLAGHMTQLPSFVQRDQQLQEDIKTKISVAVDGMFLLAQIYLGSLDDKLTPAAIEEATKQFRKQSRDTNEEQKLDILGDAYEQTMERINGQKPGFREVAQRVLLWITCAMRRLTTLELQHALAVKAGDTNLNHMISACAGLVTVDEESGIIRLVHYTTQEYFERKQKSWFPNAEVEIASICVTYLSFNIFESGVCRIDQEFEERLRLNPLYNYASHNWGHHARKASTSIPEALSFVRIKAQMEASIQGLLTQKVWSLDVEYSQRFPRQMTGLHLAAYFGVSYIINSLLEYSAELDSKDEDGQTPLFWAVESGYKAIVQLLLKQGAELDLKDIYGQTPLSRVVQNGHETIVQLLLKQGAKLDSKDIHGQTPLSWGARRGHEAIVQLLLKQGAEPDSKDKGGRTPLSQVAKRGHEAVMQLLLKQGTELDSKDAYGRTPLSQAAESGHKAIVQLLLKQGAKLDSKDKNGWTPLSWAAARGHEAVVQLLLEKGAVED